MLETKWKKPLPMVSLPKLVLPAEDGIPLESNWHRININCLIDSVHSHWRQRQDYFVAGNMFVYFSAQQVRHRDYRGPDFFVVKDVDGTQNRNSWVTWEENGRYPDLIVELGSPSTLHEDLTTKKDLYERVFRTPEYFSYDPESRRLLGWRLTTGRYEEIAANQEGWLWSEQLKLWVGRWEGVYQKVKAIWLRFYDADGALLLTEGEYQQQRAEAEAKRAKAEAKRAEAEAKRAEAEAKRAEAEAKRAKAEAKRADSAEAELARLQALLASLGIEPDN